MDDSGARVGSCRYCGSWGRPRGDGVCQPCRLWQVHQGRLVTCRRCGCRTRLNREDLCRICLIDIRYHDHDWLRADIAGQIPPRRQPQLALLLAGCQPVMRTRCIATGAAANTCGHRRGRRHHRVGSTTIHACARPRRRASWC